MKDLMWPGGEAVGSEAVGSEAVAPESRSSTEGEVELEDD